MGVKLFIDPGLEGTGYAFFSGDKLLDSGAVYLYKKELYKDWIDKSFIMSDLMKSRTAALEEYIQEISIEFQKLFSGSAKSHASVSSGDLFKLTFYTGVLSKTLQDKHPRAELKLIPPDAWKGNLNKKALEKRVKRVYTDMKFSNHELDAVGMGLSDVGKL